MPRNRQENDVRNAERQDRYATDGGHRRSVRDYQRTYQRLKRKYDKAYAERHRKYQQAYRSRPDVKARAAERRRVRWLTDPDYRAARLASQKTWRDAQKSRSDSEH